MRNTTGFGDWSPIQDNDQGSFIAYSSRRTHMAAAAAEGSSDDSADRRRGLPSSSSTNLDDVGMDRSEEPANWEEDPLTYGALVDTWIWTTPLSEKLRPANNPPFVNHFSFFEDEDIRDIGGAEPLLHMRKLGEGNFYEKPVLEAEKNAPIILNGSVEPTNLPFTLLQDITKNFSAERKIGSGGFSVVYKGVLENRSVAVKRLLNSQTIEEGTFRREASFLINVKHPNIVRFLGFCANTENQAIKLEGEGTYANYIYPEVRERLLCFEYFSKGSLDSHLTDELRGLEWHIRYGIIKGICEGLQYLHKEKCILHMDLKPANILLDDLMVPKITDFGISRHLDGISRDVTKERLVSLGYCAPEYLFRGEMSFKSDIYGLGVIIKEIVTGRKEDPNIKNVLRRWRYRWNKSATYPPMGKQQVTKCIELAVTCMDQDSKRRPFISDIVSILNEMDSAKEDVSSDNESMVGQINPYPWELLVFDPLELHFHFEPNKQMQCTLWLMNDRDSHVAFRIGTANPHYEYRIEPSNGVVPPRSKRIVTVVLAARQKAPQGLMLRDQITVRMATVEDGLAVEEISPDMFDREPGNEMVDEMDLTVVFVT